MNEYCFPENMAYHWLLVAVAALVVHGILETIFGRLVSGL